MVIVWWQKFNLLWASGNSLHRIWLAYSGVILLAYSEEINVLCRILAHCNQIEEKIYSSVDIMMDLAKRIPHTYQRQWEGFSEKVSAMSFFSIVSLDIKLKIATFYRHRPTLMSKLFGGKLYKIREDVQSVSCFQCADRVSLLLLLQTVRYIHSSILFCNPIQNKIETTIVHNSSNWTWKRTKLHSKYTTIFLAFDNPEQPIIARLERACNAYPIRTRFSRTYTWTQFKQESSDKHTHERKHPREIK